MRSLHYLKLAAVAAVSTLMAAAPASRAQSSLLESVKRNPGEAQALCQIPGHRVAATQGVAVVFHKPEAVPAAERKGGGQIEGVAQGVGHHHGLRLARGIGSF